jgi:putative tricarboxylic transport membrane protein
MAMLLPITLGLPPVSAIIMLAGIYYGAMYGGSTTAILVNIPGEAPSIVTCLDGHQMAKQGRAGPALGISAIGSFVAGTVSVILLSILAEPLIRVALRFGPPEYFSLILVGIVILLYMGRGDMFKSLISAIFGLVLSMVGMDIITGETRFGFGSIELTNGIGLVPLAMGMFGLGEVFLNLDVTISRLIFEGKLDRIWPNLSDLKKSAFPIARGSVLGFFLGILPGGGATLASFVSYAMEKKISKQPEKFGTGIIEGVAGPETANNAGAGGAFVPLFTLGIPPNSVMAMLLGALILHGLRPGPLLIMENPEVFWGTVASMYVGNVMLLILNLPLIGLWIQILKVPYRILFPLIIFFTIIGSYTLRNSPFDVYLLIVFGVVGYLMKKFDYEAAPLILAFVLGDKLENTFRQSLIIGDGNFSIFFTRPISAVCLVIAAILFLTPFIPWLRRGKEIIAAQSQEEEL